MTADLHVSNVLRVPRPAGSGRPNTGRKMVSLYISQDGIAAVAAVAERTGASKSDVYRLALARGLEQAERELKRGKSDA